MRTPAKAVPPGAGEAASQDDPRAIVSRVLGRLRRGLPGQKEGISISKGKGSLLVRADRLDLSKHRLLLKVLPESL